MLALVPQARTRGVPVVNADLEKAEACVELEAAAGRNEYEKIWPSRANTTVRPSGDSTGVVPGPSSRAVDPSNVRTAQIVRSAPRGSLVGSATQPLRLGCDPRTKVTTLPSSEKQRRLAGPIAAAWQ